MSSAPGPSSPSASSTSSSPTRCRSPCSRSTKASASARSTTSSPTPSPSSGSTSSSATPASSPSANRRSSASAPTPRSSSSPTTTGATSPRCRCRRRCASSSGSIVGLPALRIRGLYLAIVTLAVAYVFPTLVLKYDWLTGGPNGKKPDRGARRRWCRRRGCRSPMTAASPGRCGSTASSSCSRSPLSSRARNFIKSRPGRALIAVRDNQTSASISGVNLSLYKTMAFGVSAAYGGLAGSMLMINRPFASDVQFGLTLAIFLVVGLVAGGAGTISGAVPGALIYVFVPYFVSEWTTDQSGMPPGAQAGHQAAVRLARGPPGRRRHLRRVLRPRAADPRVPAPRRLRRRDAQAAGTDRPGHPATRRGSPTSRPTRATTSRSPRPPTFPRPTCSRRRDHSRGPAHESNTGGYQ